MSSAQWIDLTAHLATCVVAIVVLINARTDRDCWFAVGLFGIAFFSLATHAFHP